MSLPSSPRCNRQSCSTQGISARLQISSYAACGRLREPFSDTLNSKLYVYPPAVKHQPHPTVRSAVKPAMNSTDYRGHWSSLLMPQ
jgi:hypothetical protein